MSYRFVKSLAFSLVTVLAVSPAHAVILSLDVTPQPAQIGEIVHATFSIDSQGAEFDGFTLNLDYDPNVVRYRDDLIDFTVFTPGYTPGLFGTTADPSPATGNVIVSAAGLLANYNGSFDLVKFAFEAISPGTTTITLNDNPAGLIVFRGDNVQSGPVSGDINVVPLPASALLLSAALAGLAAFRRRSS